MVVDVLGKGFTDTVGPGNAVVGGGVKGLVARVQSSFTT